MVKRTDWCRNPIDRFVLAKLEENGWVPNPDPPPLALLRRIHFDLCGLPPSLSEQDAIAHDPSPGAFDGVIDNLLARPTYGERWGRHWLDLVRFAESNGFERDATKPQAWRYRDWVIAALNADKPYNQFVLEQIAGDELPGGDAQSLIATGLHRLGPWDDEPADPAQDHFDQLDDVVSTTSEVFLGLTLGCARCHDHKFEPLSSIDYTRMVAVFAPLERPRVGRRELDLPAGSRAQIQALAERDRRLGELRRFLEELRGPSERTYLDSPDCPLPELTRRAFQTAAPARSADQRRRVEQSRAALDQALAAWMGEEDRIATDWLEVAIVRERNRVPDLPRGYFLHEPSPIPPETRWLARGRASSPGPVVAPGVPAVLVASQPTFLEPDQVSSRRRLSLARWIVRADHPLTARVMVNRVWQYHFGEGLVRTPSDFGTAGDPPTHPELLDWLANWFVHEGEWSLKRLHRLILQSHTSRMAKTSRPAYVAEDPENRLLWRIPYRRLEVEAIRDAMLWTSGELNPAMFGPSMFPSVPPEALEGSSDPNTIWKPSAEPEASRRTVYAFVKRSLVLPMLEVLDFCDTTRSAPSRKNTSTAPQALTLLNSEFVVRQSQHLADRLERELGDDPVEQVRRAYRLALGRPARADEISVMTAYLASEGRSIRESSKNPIDKRSSHRQALSRMGRLLFNLNEFSYPD